ncbi:HAD family hydrolase [Rhodococcus sp. NPDC059234]|uniref:HAD family hydrolase n=1 Tax=Rhodococcus sp. NPDC059234 TaxID=3346781 RepID=UPI00366E2C34
MPQVGKARSTATICGHPFAAVLFDLDGVVTDTASLHAAAWKCMFDSFLEGRGSDQLFTPEDYRRCVDGRERSDGVSTFLRSRGIDLPPGTRSDPASADSVCGLGARKDALFRRLLTTEGVPILAGTVDVLRRLRTAGVPTAVVSASRNAARVLEAAGLIDEFDVRVDGIDAERSGLPGKPDAATFLEAARRLGVKPDRAVVVEDSVAGVRAASAGGFGLVVGLAADRVGAELSESGADVVVNDLADLDVGVATDTPE